MQLHCLELIGVALVSSIGLYLCFKKISASSTTRTTTTTTMRARARIQPRKKFGRFSDLPKEIRIIIWKHTLPGPRIVDVRYNESWKALVSPNTVPVALRVNVESRTEALKVYTICFACETNSGRIPFALDFDVLSWADQSIYTGILGRVSGTPVELMLKEDLRRIRRVALLPAYFAPKLDVFFFPNLESLEVIPFWEPGTREPSHDGVVLRSSTSIRSKWLASPTNIWLRGRHDFLQNENASQKPLQIWDMDPEFRNEELRYLGREGFYLKWLNAGRVTESC